MKKRDLIALSVYIGKLEALQKRPWPRRVNEMLQNAKAELIAAEKAAIKLKDAGA